MSRQRRGIWQVRLLVGIVNGLCYSTIKRALASSGKATLEDLNSLSSGLRNHFRNVYKCADENCTERAPDRMADSLAVRTLRKQSRLSKIKSLGQVAEWFKAAARKGCYTAQVVSEVRILPLSAKSEYCAKPKRQALAFSLNNQPSTVNFKCLASLE